MPSISIRKVEEIKDVVYKPEETSLSSEEDAYWVIRKPGCNLTIFPFYRLGRGEYPKTYGHFHIPSHEETYRVLYGKAGFLLQKMDGDRVTEIRFKVLNQGDTFTVPAGFGHVMLNLGDDYVITMDDHNPKHFDNDYGMIKKMQGLGYYIVEENDGWKAIPNPNFTDLPPLKTDA